MKEFFGEELLDEMHALVVLAFDKTKLGKLRRRDDCGVVEYYKRRGPVNLRHLVK